MRIKIIFILMSIALLQKFTIGFPSNIIKSANNTNIFKVEKCHYNMTMIKLKENIAKHNATQLGTIFETVANCRCRTITGRCLKRNKCLKKKNIYF